MKTKLFFIAYCLQCVGFAIFSGYHCIMSAVANEVAHAIIHGVCSVIDLACVAIVAYIIKDKLK